MRFNVTVTSPGYTPGWPLKGIYIRDPPLNKAKEYTVSVDPVFFQEDTVGKVQISGTPADVRMWRDLFVECILILR